MTIEEIQEECRRRYVVGTVYKSAALDSTIHTVEEDTTNIFRIVHFDSIDAGFEKGYFYCNEKFAEIISHPDNYIPESNNLILAL